MVRPKPEPSDSSAEEIRAALPPVFLLDPIPYDPAGKYSNRPCVVDGCIRVSASKLGLCATDRKAHQKAGKPDLRAWLEGRTRSVHLRGMVSGFDVARCNSALIRDELAYGLFRRGERKRITQPEVVTALSRSLAGTKFISLAELRHNRLAIEQIVLACKGHADLAKSFLLDTLDEICAMRGEEPTRRYLGIASAGGAAFTNLNPIVNTEFSNSIRRWVDYRQSAEIGSPQYLQAITGHVVLFASWLEDRGVREWSLLSRSDLLAFLAYVGTLEKAPGNPYSNGYRRGIIGSVSIFIDEASLNEWAAIPRGARWLRHERPKATRARPRLMGAQVAARLRNPGNLQLVDDIDCRLIIRITAETGLRRKDIAAGMLISCLLDLGEGKWSIAYLNSKNRKVLTVPVQEPLAFAISDHIRIKEKKFPHAKHLFARDDNDTIITLTLVNAALTKLVKDLDLHAANGEVVHVTPHMFRHQNGTDWLNSGMSILAVQKLLGHDHLGSTEIYARLSEEKVREEWEKSRAVTHTGDVVERPSGLLEDAAWTHAFLGGASQALPNGRCGMPCGETCEHANACLYCPLFMTTPDFLPVLREQRADHERMITLAAADGLTRVVEKNQKPFVALTKLIASLEAVERRDSEGTK
jgi:integrase